MTATGIVRRIDDLGRVVIPKEIRISMHIVEGDPLEIYTENGDTVCFKKYMPYAQYGRVLGELANDLREEATNTWCSQQRSVDLNAAASLIEQAGQLIRKGN